MEMPVQEDPGDNRVPLNTDDPERPGNVSAADYDTQAAADAASDEPSTPE